MPCAVTNPGSVTRAGRAGFALAILSAKVARVPGAIRKRGCSAVGSAQPCQGWGREFESRHPLECRGLFHERSRHVGSNHTRWRGRAARHRPAKPFTRVRIPSPPRTPRFTPGPDRNSTTRAIGAAVARFPDTEEVTGSIPVSPTEKKPRSRGFFSSSTSLVHLMRRCSAFRCTHGRRRQRTGSLPAVSRIRGR